MFLIKFTFLEFSLKNIRITNKMSHYVNFNVLFVFVISSKASSLSKFLATSTPKLFLCLT